MSNLTVDKNLVVETKINEKDIKFYDARWDPFEIYGFYDAKNQPVFKRLPDEIGKNVNEGVSFLYLNTAGGRVRFSTDSRYIAIKAVMPHIYTYNHMPLNNAAGFDLYEDSTENGICISRYRGTFCTPYGMSGGYESVVYLPNFDGKMHSYTINFPTYSDVGTLYIGIQESAKLGGGVKYFNKKPVVYYGSSITQGGCASRPGNCYQNFIARDLGLDYINLGFSGSGKAEDIIVDYMCTLDMCVFVADYDHNADNAEHLFESGMNMYKKIRAAKPDVPYIMLSRPDFDKDYGDSIKRRNSIIDIYRYALSTGDKNVYYIDGEGIFRGEFEDACTVDGCHPNDLGFAYMAKSIECELKRIMISKNIVD